MRGTRGDGGGTLGMERLRGARQVSAGGMAEVKRQGWEVQGEAPAGGRIGEVPLSW